MAFFRGRARALVEGEGGLTTSQRAICDADVDIPGSQRLLEIAEDAEEQ
jgi:hypothetical protein